MYMLFVRRPYLSLNLKFSTVFAIFLKFQQIILKMSQEMNILCCYSCKMYQVHIVKKASKWQCKLCNAKQWIQKVYFQGSGQDCRLHVQQLNSAKLNETFSVVSEQDTSCDYNASANIPRELDSNEACGSKWTKYSYSLKKRSLSDTEDLITDDIEVENTVSNEKSPCNDINNDSHDIEDTINISTFGTKNVIDETEKLYSTSCNHNSNIDDKCNLADNSKSNRKDYNDVANIFETYDELDDSLDF